MTGVLVDRFRLGERGVTSFVGAGGKSSLLLAVAAELDAGGAPVAMTTTTKMGVGQVPRWADLVIHGHDEVPDRRPVFVVGGREASKVIGIPPAAVRELASLRDHVLVEADGARRRSFKAPADYEPVVPSMSTTVVVVAGMSAVGGPISEVCHRPERVASLVGREVADALRPADVADVLTSNEGGLKRIPENARVFVALTQVDSDERRRIGDAVMALVEGHPRIDDVVVFGEIGPSVVVAPI